ncbi:hypothetical protein [Actinotalea ferrariae]|uniref:hypothetical protein n=1 Tax=Actinotalea ferrariae TaxID=1386098 RepID=UPI0012DCAF99|nr:hypothetical protein [Actinotalea ferrariae]
MVVATIAATGRPRTGASTMVVHGRHPLRGYPVTWRITPLTAPGGESMFVVERADGHLSDEAWQVAEKQSSLMSVEGVRELVRQARERRR